MTPPSIDRVAGRDHALDGMRALAALGVVLTHVGDWTDQVTNRTPLDLVPGPWVLPGGATGAWIQHLNVGVEVFFVISAVLLYAPFVRRHLDRSAPPGLATYATRRALRIYPAYWVALAIIVPWSAHFDLAAGWQRIGAPLLVHTYRVEGLGAGVGLRQAWTLVVEVSFYAFLPLYALGVRLLGRVVGAWRAECAGALALIAAGPAFQAWAAAQPGFPHPLRVLPPFLGVFGCGLLIAVLLEARRRGPAPGSAREAAVGGASVVAAAAFAAMWAAHWALTSAGSMGPHLALVPATALGTLAGGAALLFLRNGRRSTASWVEHANAPWAWFAAAFACMWFVVDRLGIDPAAAFALSSWQQLAERLLKTLIAACLVAGVTLATRRDRSRVVRLVTTRPLAYAGMISYGVYLWHYAAIEWAGNRLGCDPRNFLTGTPSCSGGGGFGSMLLVALPLTLLLATLSWFAVERPAIRLSHRVGASAPRQEADDRIRTP